MDEVRLLRESRGWSQVELAARAGVSNKTVSDAESERGSLNVRSLKKIAQALGVGLSELFPVEYGSWSLGALTDRARRLRDEHKAAFDAGDLERAARIYQRRVMVANKITNLTRPHA